MRLDTCTDVVAKRGLSSDSRRRVGARVSIQLVLLRGDVVDSSSPSGRRRWVDFGSLARSSWVVDAASSISSLATVELSESDPEIAQKRNYFP